MQDELSEFLEEKWLEKCLECQHSYYRINDADTLYCRCRNGKCNFKKAKKTLKHLKAKRHVEKVGENRACSLN